MQNRINKSSHPLFSEIRSQIFELCRTPKSFGKLRQETKLSVGALTHHLNILEKSNLIIKNRKQQNGKQKVGRELEIRSNTQELMKERDNFLNQLEKEKQEILALPLTIEILNKISNGIQEEKKLKSETDNSKTNSQKLATLDILIREGLILQKFVITKKGKDFLKQNEKH